MLTRYAWCIANFNSADGTTRSQRKGVAGENAPVIENLSGPKNVGTKSKIVRRQETVLRHRIQGSETLSGKIPLELSPRVRTEGPEVRTEVVLTEAFTEKFLPPCGTLCSQLWFKG
jgi:hypothetical protein